MHLNIALFYATKTRDDNRRHNNINFSDIKLASEEPFLGGGFLLGSFVVVRFTVVVTLVVLVSITFSSVVVTFSSFVLKTIVVVVSLLGFLGSRVDVVVVLFCELFEFVEFSFKSRFG